MKIRPITKNDFELIISLDKKVYPTENPVTEKDIAKWYKKNPEFGMIFEDNKKIAGTAIVIPLNKIGWEKLTNGEIEESTLDEQYLFDEKEDKEIYLHVYHLEKLKETKEFYKIFLEELKKIIPKKVTVKGFSGLCVSLEGISLFEKKLNCKEKGYICNENIFEKDGRKFASKENSKKGFQHINRCKMLKLLPEEKSIVWEYLANTKNPHDAVFKESIEVEGASVQGYNFDDGVDYEKIIDSYATTGAQATNLAKAIEIIKKMRKEKALIYLGYTSNMVSSGLRDVFRYLVKHKLVNVIVTSGGGIEEDFIKCLGDFKMGSFNMSGKELREKGLNRIGNILVPNSRYEKFEDFIVPILEKHKNEILTPSKLIHILGKEIDNEESIYYWAQKNKIPVFCPAITDGSLGDMIYFFTSNHPEFKIDVAEDIVEMNNTSIGQEKTGMIILGAGVIKHHICNANLFRNGADFSVYINNAQEFDASDAGASPDEARSWGKIAPNAEAVKVFGDATILFPLVVAKCFVDKK